MKKDDVKVDGTYLAKVNGGVVPVRITGEKWTGDKHTGWIGVNTKTNRSVRIKSAARLRSEVPGKDAGEASAPAAAASAAQAGQKVKPPNYMQFCCSLDRAVKAAVASGDPQVQERVQDLRSRATAAYKAKSYAGAVELHNQAVRAAAGEETPQNAAAAARTPHAGEGGTAEKPAKAPKEPRPAKPKKVGALEAAARVLAEAGTAMKPKEMIALMESKGLWTSPGGKTPEATLYAAIIREIAAKGKEARFRKTERGTFVSTGV